jgi:mono/diheme cytochrome c family protein
MRCFAVAQWLVAFSIRASVAMAQTPDPVADPDEHPLLPPGEGRDLMIHTCSQCHAPERAADERRDLEDFQALMVEMQGNGLAAPEGDLDTIARYLADAFPPSLPRPAKPIP